MSRDLEIIHLVEIGQLTSEQALQMAEAEAVEYNGHIERVFREKLEKLGETEQAEGLESAPATLPAETPVVEENSQSNSLTNSNMEEVQEPAVVSEEETVAPAVEPEGETLAEEVVAPEAVVAEEPAVEVAPEAEVSESEVTPEAPELSEEEAPELAPEEVAVEPEV